MFHKERKVFKIEEDTLEVLSIKKEDRFMEYS